MLALASANEIEYLEELSDEHERGVKDRAEQLRFLLPRFGERNPKAREQYKSRLDNIRRIIGEHRDATPFESKIRQATKLKWKMVAEITKDGESPRGRKVV